MIVKFTKLSNADEGIDDPRLHERLRQQLRYRSLKLIHQRRMVLRIDEMGTLVLPDGRRLKMMALHKDAQGVLMAVDVERATRLDARVRNRHVLVIGAGRYEDGNLAVSIEPQYED